MIESEEKEQEDHTENQFHHNRRQPECNRVSIPSNGSLLSP